MNGLTYIPPIGRSLTCGSHARRSHASVTQSHMRLHQPIPSNLCREKTQHLDSLSLLLSCALKAALWNGEGFVQKNGGRARVACTDKRWTLVNITKKGDACLLTINNNPNSGPVTALPSSPSVWSLFLPVSLDREAQALHYWKVFPRLLKKSVA